MSLTRGGLDGSLTRSLFSHGALMSKAADTYRVRLFSSWRTAQALISHWVQPIQELEAKRLSFDFLTTPERWEKHIERFAASSVVAIAYMCSPTCLSLSSNLFISSPDGRRVDDVDVGFVASVIECVLLPFRPQRSNDRTGECKQSARPTCPASRS